MELRRLIRGTVDWDRLEAVAREVAGRYGDGPAHVRFLEADNWLSTPMVVDEEWFVKVITRQNSLVHALFTTGRNLGAFSSGTEGFFEHFEGPYRMAEHELEATRRMRALGVNAPEPVEAFELDGLGVVVLEYLPEFRSIDEVPTATATDLAPDLFESLRRMHDAGLAHGDLRAENVLVLDGDLYFIDTTSVRADGREDGGTAPDGSADDRPSIDEARRAREAARAYDVACGLAALEPIVGADAAVAAVAAAYPPEGLLDAGEFLDFVNVRPDHDFDAPAVRGEIEKRLAD
ncbi:MAG: RIO1 family regulatory kinase/ATPase [Haloferacaceae archaeon]